MLESANELREHIRKEHNRVLKKGTVIRIEIDKAKYAMVRPDKNEYYAISTTCIDEWLQRVGGVVKERMKIYGCIRRNLKGQAYDIFTTSSSNSNPIL